MAVPYANRTAIATIPELALKDRAKLTLEEVHKEFATIVITPLKETFACIQRISRNQLRLTFRDEAIMENVMFVGLTVRKHLLSVKQIHSRKWVTITRLPYGTPREAVEAAVRPYGPIAQVRMDEVGGISNGEFSLLMEVVKPIPCKLAINRHFAYIYYRGQKRTCFRCGQEGHFVQKCPTLNTRAPPVVNEDPALDTTLEAPQAREATALPATYAQAAGNLVPPSRSVTPGTLTSSTPEVLFSTPQTTEATTSTASWEATSVPLPAVDDTEEDGNPRKRRKITVTLPCSVDDDQSSNVSSDKEDFINVPEREVTIDQNNVDDNDDDENDDEDDDEDDDKDGDSSEDSDAADVDEYLSSSEHNTPDISLTDSEESDTTPFTEVKRTSRTKTRRSASRSPSRSRSRIRRSEESESEHTRVESPALFTQNRYSRLTDLAAIDQPAEDEAYTRLINTQGDLENQDPTPPSQTIANPPLMGSTDSK